MSADVMERAGDVASRTWIRWTESRPPNASGTYRYRVTADILGLRMTPEWSEKMYLCGMGYGPSEWWPLSACRWDGYRRYITHNGLEWSEIHAEDPAETVWGGLDLLPCPFTGKAPLVTAQGRYIGAPVWHSEALWIESPAVPRRRWTNAAMMQAAWNQRVTP